MSDLSASSMEYENYNNLISLPISKSLSTSESPPQKEEIVPKKNVKECEFNPFGEDNCEACGS